MNPMQIPMPMPAQVPAADVVTRRVPAAEAADPGLERALLLAAWELTELERRVPAMKRFSAYA